MSHHTDTLILKKISGQKLSNQEYQILESWLRDSKSNRETYLQMKLAFTKTDQTQLDQFRNEVWDEINQSNPVSHQPFYKQVLKWAAVLLIVSATIFMLSDNWDSSSEELSSITYVEKTSLPGQKITTVLPDGTRVKLNSDSKLIVPDRFDGSTREVQLIGEAFFDVVRDESKPFVIKTNQLEIQVLGTSFNVSAYPDNNSSSVAVKSGKVRVSGERYEQSVDLLIDQMVEVREDGKSLDVVSFDSESVFGWMEKRLVFKDQDFEEVLNTLTKWYGLEVKFERDIISQRKYTAKYDNPNLEEVMESLSHIYQFEYEINKKELRIM